MAMVKEVYELTRDFPQEEIYGLTSQMRRAGVSIPSNLAEGAGGPKAVKYGVTKDYVLNTEVVLPSGDIIWTGANVLLA